MILLMIVPTQSATTLALLVMSGPFNLNDVVGVGHRPRQGEVFSEQVIVDNVEDDLLPACNRPKVPATAFRRVKLNWTA
jgi:hypothetical protein